MIDLPHDLHRLIGAADWREIEVGHSGTTVYQIERAHDTLYLKVASGYQVCELDEEVDRLRWLRGRLSVPQVLYAGDADNRRYLLMTAAPGLTAIDPDLTLAPETITRLLAEGMKAMHTLDITDCPYDHRLDQRLLLARGRMMQGLVDEMDFDSDRQGRTANAVYADLLATRPANEDLVFTHGDYCLPNILIDPQQQRISGFIDLGRAGMADRHQDIALCARSLAYNLGASWIPLLFDTYDREHIDPAKIDFYRMLDELF